MYVQMKISYKSPTLTLTYLLVFLALNPLPLPEKGGRPQYQVDTKVHASLDEVVCATILGCIYHICA